MALPGPGIPIVETTPYQNENKALDLPQPMFKLMRHILLLAFGIFGILLASAQDSTRIKDTTRLEKASRKKNKEYLQENYKHVRRKFDSTLFTNINVPTTSDYAEDLENVYQMLSRVSLVTESFEQLDEIDNHLDEEDSALNILKDRMAQSDRTFNVQNLQMFNMLLDALEQNVRVYTHYLNRYDTALDGDRKSVV